MIFETERMIARKLRFEDLEGYHEMQSNPKVMQFVFGTPETREMSADSLKNCIEAYERPGNDFWIWALESKASGEFLGTAALIKTEDGEDEIGYRFREKHWGNGYGTEVMRGLASYCFDSLKINELYAVADIRNIASVKILDKLMTFQREFFNEEENCTDREYRLNRTDFLNS